MILLKSTKKLNYLTSIGKDIPVNIADTFKERFFGLMGKKEGIYGLLLLKCNSIHTCFMRYNLDAIFLDENDKIVAIKRSIKPFSFILPIRNTVKVLEFPSSLHATAFLNVGSQIPLH